MTKIPYLLTNKGLTLVIEGRPHNVSSDNKRFNDIIDVLRERDYEEAKRLVDLASQVVAKSKGRITIKDGVVYGSNGQAIHNALTSRMLQMLELGLEVDPLMLFMERLEKNPSFRSREQLFEFLEACDLPILEDGRFLAYRSVKSDYWDKHTGRSAYSKPYKDMDFYERAKLPLTRGNVTSAIINFETVVSMERTAVDDDPNRTCSHGLHVCSQGYGMYGDLLLHVAVDPADVVSVPTDYNNAKMRVCKYAVLEEAPQNAFKTWDVPVYTYNEYVEDFFGDDDTAEDFYGDEAPDNTDFKAKLQAWLDSQ